MTAARWTLYASLNLCLVCKGTPLVFEIDKILSLGSNELLFQSLYFVAIGILQLDALDLIRNLSSLVTGRLDRALRVANMLEDGAIFIQILSKDVLLLAHLRQKHTKLIRDVRDGLVLGCFAPIGHLLSNGDALSACRLMSGGGRVLALDHSVHLLAQKGLLKAADASKVEPATAGVAGASSFAGKSSIPVC